MAHSLPGATGEFPDGKICEGDEGELGMTIESDKARKVIIIDFGKSVRWIGLGPAEVDGLIDLLQRHKAEIL